MSRLQLLLISIVSGVVMALSWPAIAELNTLMFFGFVPLLIVEHTLSKRNENTGLSIFGYSYLSFFIFNLITTYWIYNASLWGACMAIICNSLFMAFVFWLFHITKKRVGEKEGYISFVLYWLAFEYLHLNWELSWTWLTLGNVFASSPQNIQWYEYTGVLGGSLLILVTNLLVFRMTILNREQRKFNYKAMLIIFILPIGMKVISKFGFDESKSEGEIEVVIVQPNIDPYNEKFATAPSSQIDKMIALAKPKLTPNTDYLIFPETAIPESHWDHAIEQLYATDEIRKLTSTSPKLKTIIGSLSSHLFKSGEELTDAARKFRDGGGYYENYNSALFIDSSKDSRMHIKSKLVLGAEKIPFVNKIPLMKNLSVELGGSAGAYGSANERTVFHSKNDSSAIAPIICYESIYGEYVTEYTQLGANVFSIITNDGWWGDTPGYKQHLAYASLRAIENRKWIVRSANTGISAVVNDKGEIVEQTVWDEAIAINAKVKLNDTVTFYVKYGDYIGRIASMLAVLMILLTVVRSLNKTGKRLKI